MINVMNYKGYAARIEYDDDDGLFTGRVAGILDGVGFHAATVGGLRIAFQEAVEDYIETCVKVGKEPQKAISGQVASRAHSEIYHKILNQWGEDMPDRGVSDGSDGSDGTQIIRNVVRKTMGKVSPESHLLTLLPEYGLQMIRNRK